MQRSIFRSFAGVAMLLAVAACDQKAAEAPAATTTETAAAPTAPAPPPPPPPPRELLEISPDGANFSVRNIGDIPVTVRQVIVNNLPGDKDCDIKVFDTIPPKATISTGPFNCGNLRVMAVVTDNQRLNFDWTKDAQLKIGLNAEESGDKHLIRIENYGVEVESVQTIVINDSPQTSGCNLKVFQDIPAKTTITVEAHNCGEIKKLTVKTPKSEGSWSF